jgi:hypothetical protein
MNLRSRHICLRVVSADIIIPCRYIRRWHVQHWTHRHTWPRSTRSVSARLYGSDRRTGAQTFLLGPEQWDALTNGNTWPIILWWGRVKDYGVPLWSDGIELRLFCTLRITPAEEKQKPYVLDHLNQHDNTYRRCSGMAMLNESVFPSMFFPSEVGTTDWTYLLGTQAQ